ncbi:MAG: gas vesicle protein GvpN, partial [Dehalococcoidia bacterium]
MNQDLVSTAEVSPIQIAKDQPGFVQTPGVKGVVDRALLYLRAGLPVHFRGPAGTGKTTLAMYVAGQIGRPVILIHGDEEFGTSDLIGGETGYRIKKTVDNFIHTVLKTEEDVKKQWIDNRITVACRYGFTLLYDEFTRSRAEANNVLLAVLEERILDLPAERGGENGHLQVHPDFRAIFTSNPQEYAGVHRAQDALRDRMITINLGHYDRETEIA